MPVERHQPVHPATEARRAPPHPATTLQPRILSRSPSLPAHSATVAQARAAQPEHAAKHFLVAQRTGAVVQRADGSWEKAEKLWKSYAGYDLHAAEGFVKRANRIPGGKLNSGRTKIIHWIQAHPDWSKVKNVGHNSDRKQGAVKKRSNKTQTLAPQFAAALEKWLTGKNV